MSELAEGLAAALAQRLGGALIQDVRAGADELFAISLRLPGETVVLALSLLRGASGALLMSSLPERGAAGDLAQLRDHAMATLAGGRVRGVRVSADRRRLALDVLRGGDDAALVLRLSSRGANLAVVRGDDVHAMRLDAGEDADGVAWTAGLAEESGAAACDLAREGDRLLEGRATHLARARLSQLQTRLRAARAASQRLVLRRTDDVERLGDPSRLRGMADALAASLHRVRRGEARIETEDPRDGSPLTIELDPSLAPAQNLTRAYSRAARAERGLARASAMLAEAHDRQSRLMSMEEDARDLEQAAPSPVDVEALERAAAPLLPVRAAGRATPETEARPAGVAEYASVDGHVILAGRTARGNEVVTFRLARGNDVWLHARDSPGPHVVLKLPKGAEILQESLLDAATLAHALSKRGSEPRGDVLWCRAKDVRRVRGESPGRVTTAREKTISVRVEPERLARLKASRSTSADPG